MPWFFFEGRITPYVYLDTSATIITLIFLGRLLEVMARVKKDEVVKGYSTMD